MHDVIKLQNLRQGDVPAELRAEAYFDFDAHPFEHRALFDRTNSVCGAIVKIREYAEGWLAEALQSMRPKARAVGGSTLRRCRTYGQIEVLVEAGAVFEPARIMGSTDGGEPRAVCVARGARVIGCDLYLEKGSIYIGEGAVAEPCVGIKGPSIVGQGTQVRQGAYLREGSLIGKRAVVRGELKNCVLMDEAQFPHPCYVGDSACGYRSHFGNQATSANFGLFAGLTDFSDVRSIRVACAGRNYDVGTAKFGACMGDYCQVGCNSVLDPGTFLKPGTVVYPLSRIPKGFYGPREVLKNKPLEHGIIERASLRPL